MIELTTWFRRVIWFLAFTSATTLSPGLFLVAAALGLVFELVYNVTNARMYWDTVVGYDAQDKGNIDYSDDYDKHDKDDNPAEYDYDYDYPANAYPYPVSRNIQNNVYPAQYYRPSVINRRFPIQPAMRYSGAYPVPRYASPYGSYNQNMWRTGRRRDRPGQEEEKGRVGVTDRPANKLLNWRYLLGLPPWFMKE